MARTVSTIRLAPGEREDYGTIATVLLPDLTTQARAFPGPSAIREIAAWCDTLEAKIVSLSTPETIYRDLQGTRESLTDSARPVFGGATTRVTNRGLPEGPMLGKIGRLDLLARPA